MLPVYAQPDRISIGNLTLLHPEANPASNPVAVTPSGTARFYHGSFVRQTPLLSSIEYPDLYPGITLRLSFDRAELKADYFLQPGADPSLIRFRYGQADRIWIESDELFIGTSSGTVLRHRAPVAWQTGGLSVKTRWQLYPDGTAGFYVGDHDPSLPLVIDPYIVSQLASFGGSRIDAVSAIASAPGAVFLAGWTESPDFLPGTLAARGTQDVQAFVLRVNTNTNAIEYATYLGGAGADQALAVAADASGNVYVAGLTGSDGIATAGSAQTVRAGGSDAFLARLTPQGAVVFATYLGGSGTDRANAVALAPDGSVWVAGETDSGNFPARSQYQAAIGGGFDAFVARYTSSGALQYASWFGGWGNDRALGLAVSNAGNPYVTGSTESSNFPVVTPLQAARRGTQDAFVLKLSTDGQSISWSTYLGGSGGSDALPEAGKAIAVDSTGAAFVVGTTSSADFPVSGSWQAFGGGTDAFVARLSPAGSSLLFSTFFGGSGNEHGTAAVLASDGGLYFAGDTTSIVLPEIDAWQTSGGAVDGFVSRVAAPAAGYTRLLGTHIGGAGDDAVNGLALAGQAIFIAGQTASSAFQPSGGVLNSPDGFLLGITEQPVGVDLAGNVAGRIIQVAGAGCNAGTYTLPVHLSWTVGSVCTLTSDAVQGGGNTRWRFNGWSDGTAANPRTVVAGPVTAAYTAQFTAEYLVATSVATAGKGSVALLPAASDGFYASGTTVQVTATAISGNQFSGWTGDLTGAANPASMLVNGPKNIAASFGAGVIDVQIGPNVSGMVFTVTGTGCTPGTYSGTAALKWTVGSFCQITVPALQGTGGTRWRFIGWSDGSAANPRGITAGTSPLAYTLQFRAEYLVSAAVVPAGTGSLSVTPASADGFYVSGTTLQIAATPAAGYQLSGWTGDLTGAAVAASLLVNGPKSIIANFACKGAAASSGCVWVPPAPVSINPSAGSGNTQSFTVVYSNAVQGSAPVERAFLLINGTVAADRACFVQYEPSSNWVRLATDDGAGWSVPSLAGSGAPASNGQCTLNAAGSSVKAVPNGIEVTYALSFDPSFKGARNLYALASNESASLSSGWIALGSWTVTTGEPSVATLSPLNGTGTSGTFRAVFRHPGGPTQHYLGYVLFLPTPNIVSYTAKGSCLVEYNRISNGIRLINDTGDGWLGPIEGVAITPSAQPLSNSRCTVNVASCSALLSGLDMVVNIQVVFRNGFSGVLGTFLQEADVNDNWTGMTQFGNWTPSASVPKTGPYVGSFSPGSGAGKSATFTLNAGHTAGLGQLSMVHLLISSQIVGGQPCQVVYFPGANVLNLINDTGTDLVSPTGIRPGSGTLANSRCSVDGSRTSAIPGGSSVTVSVGMGFNPATFGGQKTAYVNAFDTSGNLTHWVQGGTWTVQ